MGLKFWQHSGATGGGSGPGDAGPPGPDEELRCSFCHRSRLEVKKLVAGERVWICDECVEVCQEVIREQDLGVFEPPASPTPVCQHLAADVVGQEAAKRTVAVALWVHLKAFASDEPPPGPRRVLLVGPRGAGKTSLLQALARVEPGLPSYLAVASRLTETGYVGENVENLLGGLLKVAGRLEVAQRGLLLLDRLEDVVARRPFATNARDISGSEVQRELVRLLDGALAEVPQTPPKHPDKPTTSFACDRLLIVATATCDLDDGADDPQRLRVQLEAQGLLPELLARFDRIVPMRSLGASELAHVAERLARPAQRLLEELGGGLELEPEGVHRLATMAASSADGGWALHAPLARLVEEALSEAPRTWTLDSALVYRLLAPECG